MRIHSLSLLFAALLVAGMLALPATALELPWEKEGGTVPPQPPAQPWPAAQGGQGPSPQTRQKYAILIGVGKFKDENVPALAYTRSDAEAVFDYLVKTCWPSNGDVTLYADEEASLAKVSDAMKSVAERAGAGDIVLVYVSTHTTPARFGGPSYILHDSAFTPDRSGLGSTLTLPMLRQFLQQLGLASAVVIIDSGVPEKTAQAILGVERLYRINAALPEASAKPGSPVRALIGNAGNAFESDTLKASYMTYFLLEGLRKFNGDLERAVAYANPIVDKMIREEKKTERGQNLTMFSNAPRVGVRLCE